MQDFFEKFILAETLAGDFSLLALLVALSIFLGLVVGRTRLLHGISHMYIAFALLWVIPETVLAFSLYAPIVVFFGVMSILTLMHDRLFDIHARSSVYSRVVLFVLGLLTSGALLGMIFRLLPQNSFVWDMFSARSVEYFSGEWTFFAWFLSPILFLFFVSARR